MTNSNETAEAQVMWVSGYRKVGFEPGSFMKALINALFKADTWNFHKLKKAFPAYGQAVEDYRTGKLHDKYLVDEITPADNPLKGE